MEHNDKIKKAFWITEDMDREIDAHLKPDNCSSRSEFVMNALKFYVGFLNTKNASAFLPEVLSATLTGTLDGFAGRISSLLFKQGVDINLMSQIIAYPRHGIPRKSLYGADILYGGKALSGVRACRGH
jgi:hypothetical protein